MNILKIYELHLKYLVSNKKIIYYKISKYLKKNLMKYFWKRVINRPILLS